ncbi:TPA: hypothetical protein IBZ30_002412 [Escherichia coli]|nr:hypothetical protein [Escherichia coli]HAM4950100.1 hypothetical protein [Escherichia coli]HAM5072141.1 hypothetical protein [Escherichia coli]HAM5373514.1 hypothetical protein [Escherichia coli]HAM5470634.1 hypothetical protein [Escherichia coli]
MCDTKRSIGRKCESGLAANVPLRGVFVQDYDSHTQPKITDRRIQMDAQTRRRERRAEKQAQAAEKRIAELQLREVVLPQCYSMLHRVDFDEPYHTEMVYRQHQVLEALHNAGINVTEAGKGEAS